MESARYLLEKQIIKDANDGDNTILVEILEQLSDDKVFGALDDVNQEKLRIQTRDNVFKVFKAIMLRYEGLTNCISQLREDADVVYVNISDDTDLDEGVVERIVTQIVS